MATSGRATAASHRLAIPIDTIVLRKVLRLVHCLQKERGASCAFRASAKRKQLSVLIPARSDTDQAIARLGQQLEPTVPMVLGKIRNTLSTTEKDDAPSTSFHKLLVSFNTLIRFVNDEYILRFILFQRAVQKSTDRRRARTATSLEELPQQATGKRVSSHHNLHQLDQMSRSEANRISCQDSGKHRRATTMDAVSLDLRQLDIQQDLQIPATDYGGLVNLSNSTAEDTIEHGGKSVLQLVDLLDVFVRLKELSGVERATLSSILAAGAVESRLLQNDLILTAENQRSQQEELSKLPAGALPDLVREAIAMGPEMQQLQNSILNCFDLNALNAQYDKSKLWKLMSLYINKLHSMELLIVEEIECCATPLEHDSSTAVKTNRSQLNSPDVLERAFDTQGYDTLQDKIQSLSAEEVKKKLLMALNEESSEEIPSPLFERISPAQSPAGSNRAASGIDSLLSELCSAPSSKEWEINLYEVQFRRKIGQGAAGTTYLARWNGLEVAVKVAAISEMGLEGWRNEAQALQKLHHPNIIRLLGSVYHPSPLTFCLVLEYCNAGDLSSVMKRCTPRNFFFHVASSFSKGMVYLHHKGIIHRDIKPSNVLLDGDVVSGNYTVKVTDFGVSTESSDRDEDKTAETGTYRWMSPQVIRHEHYTQTADVYSSGILFWQLLTREVPFADMGQIEAASAVAMTGLRPLLPNKIPGLIQSLIEECWATSADDRPSFDQILTKLSEIENKLNAEERIWIECPIGHPIYREEKLRVTSEDSLKDRLNPLKTPQGDAPTKTAKKRGIKALFSRKSTHF